MILCAGMYTDTGKPGKPVYAFLARHTQSWQAWPGSCAQKKALPIRDRISSAKRNKPIYYYRLISLFILFSTFASFPYRLESRSIYCIVFSGVSAVVIASFRYDIVSRI